MYVSCSLMRAEIFVQVLSMFQEVFKLTFKTISTVFCHSRFIPGPGPEGFWFHLNDFEIPDSICFAGG